MTNLLRQLLIILAFTIAGAGYFIYTHPLPCTSPIAYSIGTFYTSFGISEANFKKAIVEAEAIWEKPVGKELFAYADTGGIPINLIYDSRQQTTQQNAVLQSDITINKTSASSVKAEYTALQIQYATAEAAYTAKLASYTSALSQYNAQVDYWNKHGGAPKSEYAKLNLEKESLTAERLSLEQDRANINTLSAQINALIATYNGIVGKINSNVNVINGTAGEEFNEGEYIRDAQGKRINIYEFSSHAKLVRVLAHELGHALGLGHNDNPASIMYALNQSSAQTPSADDLSALKAQCSTTYLSMITTALYIPNK